VVLSPLVMSPRAGLLCGTVVLYEDSFTSVRGLSGGSVTLHPVALMSYPWAQSGSPYRA
jgi:hypothetical protein